MSLEHKIKISRIFAIPILLVLLATVSSCSGKIVGKTSDQLEGALFTPPLEDTSSAHASKNNGV